MTDLVHHFIDVCLEGLDYQPGEPPPARIFWSTASRRQSFCDDVDELPMKTDCLN